LFDVHANWLLFLLFILFFVLSILTFHFQIEFWQTDEDKFGVQGMYGPSFQQ